MTVKYTLSGNRLEVVSYPTRNNKPYLFDWQMFKKYCPDEYQNYMDKVQNKNISIDLDEIIDEMTFDNVDFTQAILNRVNKVRTVDKIANDLRSSKRAEKKLQRLMHCNLNKHSKQQFMTLTFAEEIEDKAVAFKLFDRFRRKMLRKCPDFKYIGVTEIQGKRKEKTGKSVIHFHLVCFNCPFKSNKKGYVNKELDNFWKHGKTDLQTVKDEKIAFYLIKYLSKDVVSARDVNKKRYFTSKNLLQPEIYKDVREYVSDVVAQSTLQYEKEIDHDFIGMIRYQNFLLTDEQSELFRKFAKLSIV
ncbi:MAG: rolling circle replication-associated protein [Culicoidibacterales bacterium]